MRNSMIVVIASAAALLLIVAAAVLTLQDRRDEQDGDSSGEEDDSGADKEGDAADDRGEQDPTGSPEPDLDEDDGPSIEVTSAWIDDGDCLTENEANNATCHRVQLLVHASADAPFDVSVSAWEAEDAEGEMHSAAWVVSPDPVPAGTSRSVTVSFDGTEEIRLTGLRYSAPGGPDLTAEIPGY